MRELLSLILFTSLITHVNAQGGNVATSRLEKDRFMVDANGRLLTSNANLNEEGSPYFSKEFLEGSVTILKGKTYHGLQLKVNFYTNEVVFLDSEGNEMVVAQPVERVELNSPKGKKIFRTGYNNFDGHDNAVFYEVLDSGTVSILKYTEVKFSERQPYPNARFIRTYRDRVLYYIAKGADLQKAPKSVEEVALLFDKQREQINTFIKKEQLKLKKEDDMIKLFHYANSIAQ
jgi:hypothetical protein